MLACFPFISLNALPHPTSYHKPLLVVVSTIILKNEKKSLRKCLAPQPRFPPWHAPDLAFPLSTLTLLLRWLRALKASDVPASVGDDSYGENLTWLLTASLSSPCLTAWKRAKTSLKQNPKLGSYVVLA
jgi:hypothetical protein